MKRKDSDTSVFFYKHSIWINVVSNVTPLLHRCACVGLWVCMWMCVCVVCSWRCQVVPSTVGSWHAVRQWSDWSKTTREEQAELPAAISLPVSDGYGQGSQICSARFCYAVRKSQCSHGDSLNNCLVSTGNLYDTRWDDFSQLHCCRFIYTTWQRFKFCVVGLIMFSWWTDFKVKSLSFAPIWAEDQSLEQLSVSCTQTHQHNGFLPKLW